ncbi:E3 ubiquitin-protein ligase SH3RF3 isoform X3 [Bombus impatiens]|uniref:RING-type E3 ubiquitin transferase n=2 Tax=Pyrobombus TaxID=144703 RepID=A0A6P8MFV9_9HYME|nr:E3 ubiquitin-protein ligase SH3RF3 isoform X3 [Bombus impatiens]XP_033187781.1 E3 ubiquitin-protein ligase SH3RF3-like isoform X3 [Bombus vancouverensis nearcticus]XP_033312711.1 E3 ubiquitin-protein ligase SH3RF3-like isoform X3 [Bombus bifarius]
MDECMLNDLLECSVCLERLDTSSKVLPCQHTFCKKCLEEIVSTHRELRCPECRILVDAKVDDLPPNVLLMRILEGMRNAAPKSTKSITKSNAGPQRLFGGHQVTSTPIVTTSPTPVAFTNEPVRHGNATAKQVQLHNQTYGRAIYDYVSKVPGDLSFKKGDIVILRKKIDNNWCFGESASSHGVFPLSYVQVITPLTPDVPQCKALYDFRMTNDDEDGCLTFNKGEIISVIRRVDENWAEGKLLDRIGIFPLAFVELNSVARALMKLSTNAQPGPSRVAPPTPTNEETTLLIPTDHSRNLQTSQPRPQLVQTSTSIADHNLRHRRSGSSDLALAQSSQSSSATTGNTHLPAAYIALYPYKPQKADELELRKGGVYMVTERCQDGWFKGTSNRTQKCGVFPGNYVTLAKCQRGLCRGSPNTGQHQNFPSSTSQNNTESRITTTYTKNKGATPQPYNARTLLPPELPPRAISPSFMVSSSWHGQSQTQSQENSPPRYKEQNSANPLGRSHSAVMSSNISSPGKQVTLPQSLMTTTTVTGVSNSGTVVTGATSSIMNEVNKSPNSVLHAVASPSSTASVSVPKNTEKQKEKKDKCVSLMRRLTNIKKSKSPPPTTYSMDNPVFEDGNSINPVHVRSGSCPSQLLQVGATQELNASNNHHRLCPGSVQGHVTSSQRLKYKERPSLPVSILQRSNESGGMACTPMGNHHRKSNSLDAGMGKQTKQQPTRERERVYRFRCIVPYPPNSEFELELRVGDIIYVHKKRDDGWYKGTQQRTGRTGLFPASFVEAF